MDKVIIIGTEHHNTLGAIRCFALKDINVTVLLSKCSSKSYLENLKNVSTVKYFKSSEDIINYLISKAVRLLHKSIIISCTDEISLLLNETPLLKNNYEFFSFMNSKSMRYYMDKNNQTKIASSVGLKIPQSMLINNKNDVISVSFPCILKPAASINGGKHICVCTNSEDYKKALVSYGDVNVLVQDFINKDEEIVVLGLTLDNEVIIPACVKKHREYNGGTTYSSLLPIESLPRDLILKIKHFLKIIHYKGLWGMELIKASNDYYFIEINLRNDATTYSAAVAGVNLPIIYYLNSLGLSYENEKNKTISSINSIVEINDFAHTVLRMKMNPFKWYKEYKMAKCKYYSGNENILISAIISKINKIFR